MYRKFLGGLVFGTGFAIAFLAVVGVIGYFALPRILVAELNALEQGRGAGGAEDQAAVSARDCGARLHAGPEAEIEAPPSITASEQYLGVGATYGNDFDNGSKLVLAAGPGVCSPRRRLMSTPTQSTMPSRTGVSFRTWTRTASTGKASSR